jgi:hypothetical protein
MVEKIGDDWWIAIVGFLEKFVIRNLAPCGHDTVA